MSKTLIEKLKVNLSTLEGAVGWCVYVEREPDCKVKVCDVKLFIPWWRFIEACFDEMPKEGDPPVTFYFMAYNYDHKPVGEVSLYQYTIESDNKRLVQERRSGSMSAFDEQLFDDADGEDLEMDGESVTRNGLPSIAEIARLLDPMPGDAPIPHKGLPALVVGNDYILECGETSVSLQDYSHGQGDWLWGKQEGRVVAVRVDLATVTRIVEVADHSSDGEPRKDRRINPLFRKSAREGAKQNSNA